MKNVEIFVMLVLGIVLSALGWGLILFANRFMTMTVMIKEIRYEESV